MKTKLLERYDVRDLITYSELTEIADREGEWMKAEDVLNQRAIDADKIKTLELQLKEAKAEAAAFVPAGATANGVILYQRKGKT